MAWQYFLIQFVAQSKQKAYTLQSIRKENTHVEQNWIIVIILLLPPISVTRNSLVFRQLVGIANFWTTNFFDISFWINIGNYIQLDPNKWEMQSDDCILVLTNMYHSL